MLSVRELAEFAVRHDGGRTLSAYVALPGHSPPGALRPLVRQGLARLRDGLTLATHVERSAFDACADRLLARAGGPPAPRAGGTWVGIASADGTTHDEWLPRVVPTTFAWEDRVRIAPYFAAVDPQRVIVVVSDRKHAAFFVVEGGAITPIESWVTAASLSAGPHMSAPPRPGFGRGTGGLPGADVIARQAEQAVEQHLSRVVDACRRLNAPGAAVIAFGATEFTARLVAALETRPAIPVIVGGYVAPDAAVPELRVALQDVMEQLRAERAQAFVAEIIGADDPASRAVGLEAVGAAIAQGAVSRLVLSERSLADHPASAEDLLRRALATGADVEFVSGDAGATLYRAAGGVGATLRFAPTPAVRMGS